MEGELDYAEVGGASIAYRVLPGDGDHDIVVLFSGVIPIGPLYDDPVAARLLDGLRTMGRVVLFDRRGVGLSDPAPASDVRRDGLWADDLAAVIEATALRDPVVIAAGFGAPAAAIAASQSVGVSRLVLFEPWNPWADIGGDGDVDDLSIVGPDRADEPEFRQWWEHAGRVGASPSTARRLLAPRSPDEIARAQQAYKELDVPTLVIRREASRHPIDRDGLDAADAEVSAHRLTVPGRDTFLFGAHLTPVLAAISEFVTGEVQLPALDRVLSAVLFTDVGGSTERAHEVGDTRWRAMIERHDEISHTIVERYEGRVVKTTGDGVLALTGSATAAIGAARAIRETLAEVDLEIRAGIHVGDLVASETDVTGLTVNIAARTMDLAKPGQILVTEAAAMAAIGAGYEIRSHGRHRLRGLPDKVTLHKID